MILSSDKLFKCDKFYNVSVINNYTVTPQVGTGI